MATAGEDESTERLTGFAAGLLDSDVETPRGLFGPQAAPADRRYSVYRNNVVVGLMEAMRAAYPSLLAIMGDATFDLVARNFIYRHPPRSTMMQAYGAGFDIFLATFPPLAGSPWLSDVARAERAWLAAYHAVDAPVLTAADISGIEGEAALELSFLAHPALAIVRSAFPVATLFQRRFREADGEIDLGVAQNLLITRPQLDVEAREISEADAAFLEALAGGRPLGEAADAGFGVQPQFDLSAAIGLALAAGCLRKPGIRDEPSGRR